MIPQLVEAERCLQAAARSAVTEIPPVLERAVTLLQIASSGVARLPAAKRPQAVAQLKSFRESLILFSRGLRRSEAIFQGYLRHAGACPQLYGPAGAVDDGRDPAIFNLAV